ARVHEAADREGAPAAPAVVEVSDEGRSRELALHLRDQLRLDPRTELAEEQPRGRGRGLVVPDERTSRQVRSGARRPALLARRAGEGDRQLTDTRELQADRRRDGQGPGDAQAGRSPA